MTACHMKRWVAVSTALIIASLPLNAQALQECMNGTYHIDAELGNNAFDGCSPQTAWKNFDRISPSLARNPAYSEIADFQVQLQPGDSILLKRGSVWEAQHLAISTQGITVANYADGSGTNDLPLLRGAAGLAREPVHNSDLDITMPSADDPLRHRFMGWAISLGTIGSGNAITAAADPRGLPGYSARLQYVGGARPQMFASSGFNLGVGLPVRLSLQTKVDSGELGIYIKNDTTLEYLDSSGDWVSVATAARTLTNATHPQMSDVIIDFVTTGAPSNYTVIFRPAAGSDSYGDAYIDDVVYTMDWVEHSPGVFKRASFYRYDAVRNIYDNSNGGLAFPERLGVQNLDTKGEWFWEMTRTFKQTFCRSDTDYFDLRTPVAGACESGYTLHSNEELNAYCVSDPQSAAPAPYSWRFPRLTDGIYSCDAGFTWYGQIPDTYTLYIYWPDGLASLRQADLKVHRSNTTLIELSADDMAVDGLALELASEGMRIRGSNTRISNNQISNIETRGIFAAAAPVNLYNLEVSSNTVTNAGGAIYLQRSHNSLVSGNTVRNIRNRGTFTDHEALALESGTGVQFVRNVVEGAALGIDLWGNEANPANYNVIAYNRVQDADGVGIVLGGGASWIDEAQTQYRVHVAGNNVYYNIVTTSGFGDDQRGAGLRQNWTPWLAPNYYYNNTLVANRRNFMGDGCFSGNFVFKNNLSYLPELEHLSFDYTDPSHDWYSECLKRNDIDSAVLEHNLYYPDGAAGSGIYLWKGVRYDTFDAYAGIEGSGKDTLGSFSADPLFADTNNADYHLTTGSPAVDAGAAVGLTSDFDGHPIIGAPDIGAFELADVDTDGDGLTDAEELALGTDRLLPDTDRDTLNDLLDTQPLDLFNPDPQGVNLAIDAGFQQSTGSYTSGDTLYILAWDQAMGGGANATYTLDGGGLRLTGSLTDMGDGSYEAAVALADFPTTDVTVDVRLQIKKNKFSSVQTISVTGDTNAAPVVSIQSPFNGTTATSGEMVNFSGSANDAEDGDLTVGITWTSSIDGLIGSGSSFTSSLSDGSHVISAAVTDSGGRTGTASVNITVGSASCSDYQDKSSCGTDSSCSWNNRNKVCTAN